jgi:uncharacterized membrane protein
MDLSKRSWAKSITWRIVGIVLLGLISYLVTRDWGKTTGITIIFHGLRLVLYYFHERLWERVNWGRIRHPLAHLALREDITLNDIEEIGRLLEDRRYILKHPDYEI